MRLSSLCTASLNLPITTAADDFMSLEESLLTGPRQVGKTTLVQDLLAATDLPRVCTK